MCVCMYLFEVFVLVFRMVYQTKPKVGAKAPMQQNNALYTRAYTNKNKHTYICKQLRVCTKSSRILCYIIKTRYDWLMGGMWQVASGSVAQHFMCVKHFCKEFAAAAWKQKKKTILYKNKTKNASTKTIASKVCATIFVLFHIAVCCCVAVLWSVSVGVALVH